MIDLLVNIEPHTSHIARNMTILFVTIFLLIIFITYTKAQNDKIFGQWFEQILELAPEHGFTKTQIDDFEEIFWWDYFLQDMTPSEALDFHLKHN